MPTCSKELSDGGSVCLRRVLLQARRLGFLGPGPVEAHVRHSLGFAAAAGPQTGTVVDLGSGGGVPGIVLAVEWPEATVLLLDANERRTAFLAAAVEDMSLDPARVLVRQERAEVLGRQEAWRSRAELVVARGFGPPATVAECAAPLLQVGGRLIVSEPPAGGAQRWPTAGLAPLGMVPMEALRRDQSGYQILRQQAPCPPQFARRVGKPRKRPLF